MCVVNMNPGRQSQTSSTYMSLHEEQARLPSSGLRASKHPQNDRGQQWSSTNQPTRDRVTPVTPLPSEKHAYNDNGHQPTNLCRSYAPSPPSARWRRVVRPAHHPPHPIPAPHSLPAYITCSANTTIEQGCYHNYDTCLYMANEVTNAMQQNKK